MHHHKEHNTDHHADHNGEHHKGEHHGEHHKEHSEETHTDHHSEETHTDHHSEETHTDHHSDSHSAHAEWGFTNWDQLEPAQYLIPLLGGVAAAILAGVLGCFIIWRRMAYFGDAVGHSAMLGAALGVLFSFNTSFGIWAVAVGFAVLLIWLRHKALVAALSIDSWMGILAHATFAFALILAAGSTIDLHGFLFGDIMAITTAELWWILPAVIASVGLVAMNWSNLVLMSLNEELAHTAKINTLRTDTLLTVLMATAVALGIKVVGILLITSMLIIPASTAKLWTNSPVVTVVLSGLWSAVAVVAGIAIASGFNLPSGPTMVMVLTAAFTVSLVAKQTAQ